MKIANTHAEKAAAKSVTDVYIVIGRLSSLVDDSVQFYWDFMSKGTLCEGSKLHFERIPARLLCLDCSNTYQLDGELEPCPNCQSSRVKVVAGDEFRLDSIEIAT